MNTLKKCIAIALTGAALSPAVVTGQSVAVADPGYVFDNRGNVLVSAFGLCWRDSEWTPSSRVEQCDGAPAVAATPPPRSAPIIAAASPAPIPAAIVALVPAPPMSYKMSFSGDALFAFDKSELKPEGRVMLDELVKKLSGAHSESIVLVGHTDRFGSQDYNQKLSERRAATVKDYLTEHNVQATNIGASGKGKSEPVTAAADCHGARSAQVIACLQPDRRVDVEMTGTTPLVGLR